MKTMFDVNDVIEFTVSGRIEEYSVKARRGGFYDCYVIAVSSQQDKTCLYVSSKDLEVMGAKKVADHDSD